MCRVCCAFALARRTMSTMRPKVYVTRNIPVSALEMLKSQCQVSQWQSDDVVPRKELLSKVDGIAGLYCLLTDRIDSTVLNACGSALKVVSTMSVGYDHIDIAACRRMYVPVGFTPDVLTDATAELTMALLLATSRRLTDGIAAVKEGTWGTWKPMWLCGQGLASSTVGIVGLGRIGKAVAKCVKPFNASKILYTGRTQQLDAECELGVIHASFTDLLDECDFIIVCCALTPETRHLFSDYAFSKMKKTAILINTSRGSVIDMDSLYLALKTGKIGAAGLDVTDPEPLPTDSPLLTLPNCVVLPHIGSATINARVAMAELASRNILAALNGACLPSQVQ